MENTHFYIITWRSHQPEKQNLGQVQKLGLLQFHQNQKQ